MTFYVLTSKVLQNFNMMYRFEALVYEKFTSICIAFNKIFKSLFEPDIYTMVYKVKYIFLKKIMLILLNLTKYYYKKKCYYSYFVLDKFLKETIV